MKAVEAMNLFHGRENFNCAQAVLKAFQMESGVSENTIQKAAYQGGGRAPEGVCGALHAARVILKNGSALEGIEKDFAAKTGSKKCREILRTRTLPCRGCVALSADLLERHINIDKSQIVPSHNTFMNQVRTMVSGIGSIRCPGC
jgi:hypothetical protein